MQNTHIRYKRQTMLLPHLSLQHLTWGIAALSARSHHTVILTQLSPIRHISFQDCAFNIPLVAFQTKFRKNKPAPKSTTCFFPFKPQHFNLATPPWGVWSLALAFQAPWTQHHVGEWFVRSRCWGWSAPFLGSVKKNYNRTAWLHASIRNPKKKDWRKQLAT